MQDFRKLAKTSKEMKYRPDRECLDDLTYIRARDIPENQVLPDGTFVKMGSYPSNLRGRWYVALCPKCGGHARKLYLHNGHFSCHRCTKLDYISVIASRSIRTVYRLPHPESPEFAEALEVESAKENRDKDKDMEYHRRERARKAAQRQRET